MKRLAAPLFAVIFTLLSGGYANGGDWHSAGNAPTPNYIPKLPVAYTCKIAVRYNKDGRYIDAERTVSYDSKDFADDGIAYYSITGEKTKALNGQAFKLSFNQNQDGTENAVLTVFTRIRSNVSDVSVSNGRAELRSEGKVAADGGTVSINSRTIRVRAECVAN